MEVTYTSGQKLKTSESSYNLLPFSLVVFTQGVVIAAIFSGFLHFFKLYAGMENDQKHTYSEKCQADSCPHQEKQTTWHRCSCCREMSGICAISYLLEIDKYFTWKLTSHQHSSHLLTYNTCTKEHGPLRTHSILPLNSTGRQSHDGLGGDLWSGLK